MAFFSTHSAFSLKVSLTLPRLRNFVIFLFHVVLQAGAIIEGKFQQTVRSVQF